MCQCGCIYENYEGDCLYRKIVKDDSCNCFASDDETEDENEEDFKDE